MKIAIDKDSILDDVKMTVSVIVRDEVDGQGNSLYPIVMPTSRDDGMLALLYEDGIKSILSALKGLYPVMSENAIELNAPDFTEEQEKSVCDMADSCVKDGIVGAWLKLKGSSMYQPFIDSSLASLNSLKGLLFNRKAPQKKTYGGGAVPYSIFCNNIAVADTFVEVGVRFTVDGKEDSLSLFAANRLCGLTLRGTIGGKNVTVLYEEGVINGFVAKFGDTLNLELLKGIDVVDTLRLNVI